ncbi:MAG: DUF4349 domain-containing protein [Candidatus Brocadiae bacterium]|nr:DUF4349 domain-containing protein [Candidatus Brocadiia bacterium]
MKTLCVPYMLLVLVSFSFLAAEQEPHVVVQASLVLKVSNPVIAAKQMLEKVSGLGGYFSLQTQESLVLKVPRKHIQSMIATAIDLGVVVGRNFEAKNVGLELEAMKARLQSQSDVLEKFLLIMNSANQEGIVSVETEITKLLEEIDKLKGSLRLLEHRLEYAELRIDFRFRERKAPVPNGVSSFPWLNTMNLEDLIEEFKHD